MYNYIIIRKITRTSVFVYRCIAYFLKAVDPIEIKIAMIIFDFLKKSENHSNTPLTVTPAFANISHDVCVWGGGLSIKILWSFALIQGAKNSKLLIKKDLLAFNLMAHLLK